MICDTPTTLNSLKIYATTFSMGIKYKCHILQSQIFHKTSKDFVYVCTNSNSKASYSNAATAAIFNSKKEIKQNAVA